MIYFQLFISFFQVGLFSIGGGYAAIPLIQSEVVTDHGWLTMKEFTDLITIAEMTPGPVAVNSATFVGIKIAGLAGALIATSGCILPSCFLVSGLFFLYNRYKNISVMQNIMSCIRPAIVALIAVAGLSFLKLTVFDGNRISFSTFSWSGAVFFGCAFALIRKCKWNPIAVMLLCGISNMLLHSLF